MLKIKKQKLPPEKVFYRRLWKNAILGILIMALCLFIGVLGYKLSIPELD